MFNHWLLRLTVMVLGVLGVFGMQFACAIGMANDSREEVIESRMEMPEDQSHW